MDVERSCFQWLEEKFQKALTLIIIMAEQSLCLVSPISTLSQES